VNREFAKQVSLKVATPRTKLILFDDTGHKTLAYHTVRHTVKCFDVIDVLGMKWKVEGWGPSDGLTTDCRAICKLVHDI
jgi:hypothetical protein